MAVDAISNRRASASGPQYQSFLLSRLLRLSCELLKSRCNVVDRRRHPCERHFRGTASTQGEMPAFFSSADFCRRRRQTALGSAAERRRRCRDRDQELKRDPLPCLINSAGSSTYPTRKSVRTTRATPQNRPSDRTFDVKWRGVRRRGDPLALPLPGCATGGVAHFYFGDPCCA